mgnify:CR=1 FL=1
MRKNVINYSLALALLSTPLFAETVNLEMLNKRDDGQKMVYSEDIAYITEGDTINWIAKDKGHNVEFIDGPKGWEAPKKSSISKDFTYTFDEPGVYTYVCTPHATMGMIATVVVGDVTEEHIKSVEDAKAKGKSKKKYEELLTEIKEKVLKN